MAIRFDVEEGSGAFVIGDAAEAELVSFRGATGAPTAMHDTVFSTIPGSPTYVGKAKRFRRSASAYGMRDVEIEGKNAIQGHFHFAA